MRVERREAARWRRVTAMMISRCCIRIAGVKVDVQMFCRRNACDPLYRALHGVIGALKQEVAAAARKLGGVAAAVQLQRNQTLQLGTQDCVELLQCVRGKHREAQGAEEDSPGRVIAVISSRILGRHEL